MLWQHDDLAGDLPRIVGEEDAIGDLEAFVFTPGDEGDVGELSVGAAGDVDHDGVEDLVIGAAEADPEGRTDAGKAYIVYGSLFEWEPRIPLWYKLPIAVLPLTPTR